MTRKIALICNIHNGIDSNKRQLLEFAEKYLQEHSLETISILTQDLNELTCKVHECLNNGFIEFLTLGGDGSLHHLVNIIMKQNIHKVDEIRLGVLPCGTGNDWLRTYYSKNQVKSILTSVVTNSPKKQDIGKIVKNDSDIIYFVNIAGVGFNGFLMQYIDKFKRWGDWAYYIAIFYTFWHYKPVFVMIENHFKKKSLETFMISIGICKFAGGNMKLCPQAIPDDGLFDVNIIEKVGTWDLIKNILFLKDGSYISKMKIKTERFSFLNIYTKEALYLEADGEFYGAGSYTFQSISESPMFF